MNESVVVLLKRPLNDDSVWLAAARAPSNLKQKWNSTRRTNSSLSIGQERVQGAGSSKVIGSEGMLRAFNWQWFNWECNLIPKIIRHFLWFRIYGKSDSSLTTQWLTTEEERGEREEENGKERRERRGEKMIDHYMGVYICVLHSVATVLCRFKCMLPWNQLDCLKTIIPLGTLKNLTNLS